MSALRATASVLLLCVLGPAVAGQNKTTTWQIPQPLLEGISGERAKTHVIELSRWYREDATPGYHQAILYLAEQARRAGLEDVHIDSFHSDGETAYLNMRTRSGWKPGSAELWLVEPRRKLADFSEVSTHLATWSAPADVTTDLVDVGVGTVASDYQGKDVRGKLVLVSSPPEAAQHEAVTIHGAAGIISDWSPASRASFPDEVNWLDTANNRERQKTFAFVLSRRQGTDLRAQLQRGPVRLRAKVDAELGPGVLEDLTGTISGTHPNEGEIVLTAHVCHFAPSSNDNGSGTGLLLEIARAWAKAIADGTIQRPRRTVRFLWVNENYGTVALLAKHPEAVKRFKAVLDLDMVGEDLDRCNSVFRIVRTPESRPSYLVDVVAAFAQLVADREVRAPSGSRSVFRWEVNNYIGGSDHVWYNDAGTGVPALLLMHWPDNFYHTSEDAPDKVDPTELRRVGVLSAASAALLANIDAKNALSLASLVAASGRLRIAADLERAAQLAESSDHAPPRPIFGRLLADVERETAAISSVANLEPAAATQVWQLSSQFHREQSNIVLTALSQMGLKNAPNSQNVPGSDQIYERRGHYLSALWESNLRSSPLSSEDRAAALVFLRALPGGPASVGELFNLVDGHRTVEDILSLLESERNDEYLMDEYFGDGSMQPPPPFPSVAINRSEAVQFFALAEKAGLLALRSGARR